MLKYVDENNFENEILEGKKVILVDFFATWCGPCQILGPILEIALNCYRSGRKEECAA